MRKVPLTPEACMMFSKTLRRAAELVEQGWCQWRQAADNRGHEVTPGREGDCAIRVQ